MSKKILFTITSILLIVVMLTSVVFAGPFAWDPRMTKKCWVFASDPSYNNWTDANGDTTHYWDYTGLNTGNPSNTSWWGHDWNLIPGTNHQYKLTWCLNNVNNPQKWAPDLSFIGFQMSAYHGLSSIPVIGNNNIYEECSMYLYPESSANGASQGPANCHGVKNSSTCAVISFVFNEAYNGGPNYPRFVEICPWYTPYMDVDPDPYVLFHGAGSGYEMYRITMNHPLINGPMMNPGDSQYFLLNIAAIARGLSWNTTYCPAPNWNKAAVGGAYFGFESYGDALTKSDLWNFNLFN